MHASTFLLTNQGIISIDVDFFNQNEIINDDTTKEGTSWG